MEEKDQNPEEQSPFLTKNLSIQMEKSTITQGSQKRKFFLMRKRHSQQTFIQQTTNISNIFTSTNENNSKAEMETSFNTISQLPSAYSSALISPKNRQQQYAKPTVAKLQPTGPIITESKYNFKANFSLPKVVQKKYHQMSPKYVKDATMIDSKNIRKMRRYNRFWALEAAQREQQSLIIKSNQKVQKSLKKHNIDVLNRKASINFETILRDEHLKSPKQFGIEKGIPKRSLPGLKGKGGSVRSFFQKVFFIEEVYKCDK